jgi:anti-anti-sigma factor
VVRLAGQEGGVTLLEVQVDEVEPVVVRLVGELDVAGADLARHTVKSYLTLGRTVVADVAGLSFVDSSGLAAFICCHRIALRNGCGFWLEGTHGEVASVLEITGLRDLLGKPPG